MGWGEWKCVFKLMRQFNAFKWFYLPSFKGFWHVSAWTENVCKVLLACLSSTL